MVKKGTGRVIITERDKKRDNERQAETQRKREISRVTMKRETMKERPAERQ